MPRNGKHQEARIQMPDNDDHVPARMQGTKAFAFKIKAEEITEEGSFSGYGSVFGVTDSYKEIVDKGAFAESLEQHRKNGQMPKMLWQHNSSDPIGIWTEMYEDSYGLFVRGQLALDEDPRNEVRQAREAYKLMKMGALDGLSIGYSVAQHLYDAENEVIHLVKLDLHEVSPVTFPANTSARVSTVKSIRGLERLLRDAGFSRKDASAIASHGWGALEQRDAVSDEVDLSELISSMDALQKQMEGKE